MATNTLTKTYVDNHYTSSTYKKTWTVTYLFDDIVVNNSTFTLTTPTIKAKFTGTNGTYRYSWAESDLIKLGNKYIAADYWWEWYDPATIGNNIAGASGKEFAMTKRTTGPSGQSTDSHTLTLNTNSIFDSTNKTSKTLSVEISIDVLELGTDTVKNSGTSKSKYRNPNTLSYTIGNITLDAPPQVEGVTTSQGPYYAECSSYSININSIQALYGGDITNVTLAAGGNEDTLSPNTPMLSNTSLSVNLDTRGIYVPKISVTDSRGQSTTIYLPEITVYIRPKPTINFMVDRAALNGKLEDDGLYGLITANLTFFDSFNNHLMAPTVEVIDSNNYHSTPTVSWYTTYTQVNGVSGLINNWSTLNTSPVTIYGLASQTNGFDKNEKYIFNIQETDFYNTASNTSSYTLPSAMYMLDFRAGGHGMAIGKAATRDGLEIQFPTTIGEGLLTPYRPGTESIDLTKYQLVVGKYNKIDDDAVFIIGAGTSTNRYNAMEVDEYGNITLYLHPQQSYYNNTGIYFKYIKNNNNITCAKIQSAVQGSNDHLLTLAAYTIGQNNEYDEYGELALGTENSGIELTSSQRVLIDTATDINIYGDKITIDTSNATLSSNGKLTLSSSIQTTGITVTDKSPSGGQIGAQYSASPNSGFTYTYSSGSTDWKFPSGDTTSGVNPMSLTLGAGRWLVYGYARLSGLTSGKQYGVCIGYYTGSEWTPHNTSRNFVTAGSTAAIALQALIVVSPTENTTYRVGIYHGGGATIDTQMYIRAIRIC